MAEKEEQKRKKKQKPHNKMVDLNPRLSIITLHVNGLNIPIERNFQNGLILSNCYWLNCVPPPLKVICWSPTPNVIIFEDRAFMEVLKVKWGHRGRTLTQQNWCTYKNRKRYQSSLSLSMHEQRKGYVRTQQENGHLQARKSALTRSQISWHLDLGLPSPQNCEQYISAVYKLLSLRHFVTAAQRD